MSKSKTHVCTKCDHQFGASAHRTNDISAQSILYRPQKALPLGDDIESFDVVTCPNCGNTERSGNLKLFGVIPGRYVKHVLAALLCIIVVFGAWLILAG